MSINDTLFETVGEYSTKYFFFHDEFEDFLKTPEPFLKKQEKAKILIKNIMTNHGKEYLFEYVTELARVEYDSRKLAPSLRDHVVHAMLTFILGIYINEKFLKSSNILVEPFQWKLASLFHDIGYPVQVASNDLLKPFEKNIQKIIESFGLPNKNLHFKIVPEGFEKLTNNKNSFELINKRLKEWKIKIDAKDVYDNMIKSREIDHGIISSLALLNVIDLIYYKYNPRREYKDILNNEVNTNQKFFDGDVVSACSAIYIHSLRSECLSNARIDRSKAPIAFLLRISDCLQEWERPSFENPTGFSSEQFDIEINNSNLKLHMNIPTERKDEISKDISKSLICPDVEIV